jgi:hypothetical protein
VSGKPTNHTRATGKCRKVGCPGCHSHPVNKSVVKAKGHVKRTALDITVNHHLDDWRVCAEITYDSEADLNANSGIWGSSDSAAAEGKLVLDYPMSEYDEEKKIYEHQSAAESGVEDPGIEDAGEEQAVDSDSSSVEENMEAEFPDFEAFRHEFESFKSEIEAAGKQASLPVSEDSWSGIELSDDDRSEISWDDWSLVDEAVV